MKKNIILYIVVVLLFMCTFVSMSYAYYSTRKDLKDNYVNVNIPACLNFNLIDNDENKIELSGESSLPMSDSKAISGYDKNLSYEATIENGCNEDLTISLMLAPTTSSSMPHKTVKYALFMSDKKDEKPTFTPMFLVTDNNKKELSKSIVEEIQATDGESAEYGYEISKINIAKNSKKYLKMIAWIDENEGNLGTNITINKSFVAHLIMLKEKSDSK